MSRKKTKSGGGVGTFFFGSFIGFILCLALLAGLGCFVYFKVSPNWLNKTFKTDIDLGSEGANDKTLKDLVTGVVGLMDNKDTYKLSYLTDDFGLQIGNQMFGIDISDLKEVAITDLAEEIENKFGTISADELRNVNGMNLEEEMGKILNKTNTYHYNSADNKLYNDFDGTSYSNEVSFKYEISSDKTKVITKKHETAIVSGVAKIELWYLPLTVALGDFTSNMGENITLYELEKDYGVNLPSFIKLTEQEKKDTTINELEGVINSSKVADILDLKYDASSETYFDDKNNDGIKDSGEEVTYVLNSLAGKPVEELSGAINSLKLSNIFSEAERKQGVLSLITSDPTISQIPDAIKTAIANSSIETLVSKEIITLNNEDKEKLTTTVDHDKNSETANIAIGKLTIDQFMDYCFDLI